MAQLPLEGRRFLVTRAADQAQPFVTLLEQQGAQAVCIPTIEIAAPDSWQPLDSALRDLDEVDILILTSVNAVEIFFERLFEVEQYIGLLKRMKVVAVGPKTAAALKENRITADLVPDDHRAEGVVEALLSDGVGGKKVLYPRAELARPYLVDQLTAAGADVLAPIAYRTLLPEASREPLRQLLSAGQLDAICLSSSSTFENLLTLLGDEAAALLAGVKLFSIGPQTSACIGRHGYAVALEPQSWTLDALVAAMVEYYRS